jgi:hypothetical protein
MIIEEDHSSRPATPEAIAELYRQVAEAQADLEKYQCLPN